MTRWTRRIMALNVLLGTAMVCYLYADTIMGWFPLLSQYPAPVALAFVFTISQWEVAIRGPKHGRHSVKAARGGSRLGSGERVGSRGVDVRSGDIHPSLPVGGASGRSPGAEVAHHGGASVSTPGYGILPGPGLKVVQVRVIRDPSVPGECL